MIILNEAINHVCIVFFFSQDQVASENILLFRTVNRFAGKNIPRLGIWLPFVLGRRRYVRFAETTVERDRRRSGVRFSPHGFLSAERDVYEVRKKPNNSIILILLFLTHKMNNHFSYFVIHLICTIRDEMRNFPFLFPIDKSEI